MYINVTILAIKNNS